MAGDFVSPRLFTSGGMRLVTIVAAGVVLCAVILVLVGVREVSAGERSLVGRES
jgi:hypothetical protein